MCRSFYQTKLIYIIAIVVGLLFLLFCKMTYGSGGYYMGFVTGHVDKFPIVQGFLRFVYVNKANPMTWEIIFSFKSNVLFMACKWFLGK